MFLILAVIAAMGITAIQGGLEEAGDDELVENETFTPSAGSVTTLDDSKQDNTYYDEEVVVRDENGTIVDEGTDYEWFVGNGTIKTLSGGELAGDSSADITYGYQQTTAEQRGIAGALGQMPRVIGLALPLAAVFLVLAAFRGGSV